MHAISILLAVVTLFSSSFSEAPAAAQHLLASSRHYNTATSFKSGIAGIKGGQLPDWGDSGQISSETPPIIDSRGSLRDTLLSMWGRGKEGDRNSEVEAAEGLILTSPGMPFFVNQDEPWIIGSVFMQDIETKQLQECRYLIPVWSFRRRTELGGLTRYATPNYSKAKSLHRYFEAKESIDRAYDNRMAEEVRGIGVDKVANAMWYDAGAAVSIPISGMLMSFSLVDPSAMVVAGGFAALNLTLGTIGVGAEYVRAHILAKPVANEHNSRLSFFSDPYHNLDAAPAQLNLDPGMAIDRRFLWFKQKQQYLDILSDAEINVALSAFESEVFQESGRVICPDLHGNSRRPEGLDPKGGGGKRIRKRNYTPAREPSLEHGLSPVPQGV